MQVKIWAINAKEQILKLCYSPCATKHWMKGRDDEFLMFQSLWTIKMHLYLFHAKLRDVKLESIILLSSYSRWADWILSINTFQFHLNDPCSLWCRPRNSLSNTATSFPANKQDKVNSRVVLVKSPNRDLVVKLSSVLEICGINAPIQGL